MIKSARVCFFLCLAFFSLVTSGHAQDGLYLSCKHGILSTDGQVATGYVSVYLTNPTEMNLRDVSAWVEGPNEITYDNRTIFVGDIDSGSARGAMAEWIVPIGMIPAVPSELPVAWKIEYTDSAGKRVQVGGLSDLSLF